MLLTPPNFKWQEFLEETFPGYPIQKDKQKLKVDEDGKVYKNSIGSNWGLSADTQTRGSWSSRSLM